MRLTKEKVNYAQTLSLKICVNYIPFKYVIITVMGRHLMRLNCTLEMVKMLNFVLSVFYHNKKILCLFLSAVLALI